MAVGQPDLALTGSALDVWLCEAALAVFSRLFCSFFAQEFLAGRVLTGNALVVCLCVKLLSLFSLKNFGRASKTLTGSAVDGQLRVELLTVCTIH